MPFELFIAFRHLMSRERRALISIITLISILGVVIGVSALIVVIAVMDGAQEDYLKQMIDVYAHLEIWPVGLDQIKDYKKVLDVVDRDPDVVAASPLIQRFAMLKLEAAFVETKSIQPARVLGIDPAREEKVSLIIDAQKKDKATGGKTVIGKRVPDYREIILGTVLAERLGLAEKYTGLDGVKMARRIGEFSKDFICTVVDEKTAWVWQKGAELYAITGKMARVANGIVPKQSKLLLAGLFESGIYDVDQMTAYVSLPTAQSMNVLEDVVDIVHVRLKNPYQADQVRERLETALGTGYRIRTWQELNPELFKALTLEKLGMFIILSLVVLVAALNIISTLILVTLEKTREIGILRAMGTSRRSIRRIFIMEGALIGCVGTGAGVILGLIGCYFLKYHCPINLPEAVYGLKGLPVLVKPLTVLTIMASSIGICLAASVLPAWQAARLDIVEALRYE